VIKLEESVENKWEEWKIPPKYIASSQVAMSKNCEKKRAFFYMQYKQSK
jgi:hypothetical protein